MPEIKTTVTNLSYEKENRVDLLFDTIQPDSVTITCMEDNGEAVNAYSGTELSFELKEGTYIYIIEGSFGESRVEYGFIGTFYIPNENNQL